MLKVISRPGPKQLCDQSGEERLEFNEKNALLVQQNDSEDCLAVGKVSSDLSTKMDQRSYSIGESSRFRKAIATAGYDSMQVEFLQFEHAKMLKSLYAEIERLQRRIFEISSAELNLALVERENEMEGAIVSLKSALKIANNKIEALEKVIDAKDEEIKSIKRQKSVEDKKILQRSVESVNASKPAVIRVNKQLEDKKVSVKKPTTEQLFRRKKVPIIEGGDQTQKSKDVIAISNSLHQQRSFEKNSNAEKKISEPGAATTSLKSMAATGGSSNTSSSMAVTASRQTATLTRSSIFDRKTFASTTASTAVEATRKNPIRNTRLINESNALGLRRGQSKEKPKQQFFPNNQRSKPNLSANGSKSTKKSD